MSSRIPTSRSKPKVKDAELSRRIEQLDKDLIKIANERAKLYEKWAKTAEPTPESVIDEQALTEKIGLSKGPLSPETIRTILAAVDSGSRALVRRLRVAYLGPAYSYSHLAASHHFGASHELIPSPTISAVFDEVNRRHVSFGVVPIENSTDGRIADTLDMFVRLPVRICGEVQLKIHHHLLSRSPRSEIVEVYSKVQAISQCRAWLAQHLPEARLVEMTSTTAAAQIAAERPGAAAIASRQAGLQYGLEILESDIEDNRSNMTRFAIIGQASPARSRSDKTALMLELPHSPGALADAMGVFKRSRLNLTWIESFPMPGTKSEYLFFVEVEGHETNPKIVKALAALQRRTTRTVVLGSYPKGEPIE